MGIHSSTNSKALKKDSFWLNPYKVLRESEMGSPQPLYHTPGLTTSWLLPYFVPSQPQYTLIFWETWQPHPHPCSHFCQAWYTETRISFRTRWSQSKRVQLLLAVILNEESLNIDWKRCHGDKVWRISCFWLCRGRDEKVGKTIEMWSWAKTTQEADEESFRYTWTLEAWLSHSRGYLLNFSYGIPLFHIYRVW